MPKLASLRDDHASSDNDTPGWRISNAVLARKPVRGWYLSGPAAEK
jgi:hypothetical protein